MTHRAWRVWAALSLGAALLPLDVASQATSDSASALVDLILAGDDSQEAWSSLVEALGVSPATPPASADAPVVAEPLRAGGVGTAPASARPRGPRNVRGELESAARRVARPSTGRGLLGIAVLAASFLLIALALLGKRGTGRKGARARRRFHSRDAARLEARLRSRGAS